jgi:hypothetical protein
MSFARSGPREASSGGLPLTVSETSTASVRSIVVVVDSGAMVNIEEVDN